MIDKQTGEKYARATGKKGVGTAGELDWLIQDMTHELKAWGHSGGIGGHIIMKCDNENTIKALHDAVGKLLGGRVIPEHPPKGESQSNGRPEEVGRTMRGFARVLKAQLEDSAKIDIGCEDAIAVWLVRWSAMLPSRFLIGKDGKTPFERRRGRQCQIAIERFGEKVWYKDLKSKTEGQDKADADWAEGLWLGHARSSNEVLIGTRSGVVRAWAVRRMGPEDRWDAKLIREMKGTPQQPNPNRPGTAIPIKINFDEIPGHDNIMIQPARAEEGPRSMFIKGWMLEKYGYTGDCKGCEYKRAGMEAQGPHTRACRTRVEAAVEQDARGRAAKSRAEERFQHWEEMKRSKAEDIKEKAEFTKNAKVAKDASGYKEDEPACKDSRGSCAKDDKDDRDEKSDCVQKQKNNKTARDGTQESKSREFGTAASPKTTEN